MLLAFCAIVSLGLLLFVRSWWGPIVDARVRCRKCGYDLTGGVALTGKCPECSRSLKRPGAIRAGTRARRRGRAIIGLAVAGVAGLAIFVQSGGALLRGLDPYKPGFWVLMDAQSREGRTATPALDELQRRLAAGDLSDEFVARVADVGLARMRGEDGAGPWAAPWSRFIENAIARRQLDYERAVAYADALIGPDPTVHFPAEVRSGEPMLLRATLGSAHGPDASAYRLVYWWDHVTMDGVRVAFRNAQRGSIVAGPRLGGGYTAVVDSTGPPGETEVAVHAHVAVVHADDLTHEWSHSSTMLPALADGPPVVLLKRSFTARAGVVRTPGSYEDAELLARLRAGLRVTAERIEFGTGSRTSISFAGADLPADFATYAVAVTTGDGTSIGSGELTITDGRAYGRASAQTDASTIDVVFEPNAESWIKRGPVLSGRMEFRNVPVIVRDISGALAAGLQRTQAEPPASDRTIDELLADPAAACGHVLSAPLDEVDRIVAHAEHELHENGTRAWAPVFPVARRRGRLSDAAWQRFILAALGEPSLLVRGRGAAGSWVPFVIDIQPEFPTGTRIDRFPCVRIRPVAVRVNDAETAVEAEPVVFALAALAKQQVTGRLQLPEMLGPGAVELVYELECGWTPEGVSPLLVLGDAQAREIADVELRTSGTVRDTVQIAKTATRLVPSGLVAEDGGLRRPAQLAVEIIGARAVVRATLTGEIEFPVCAWPELRLGDDTFRADAPCTIMPWSRSLVIEVPMPTLSPWPETATLVLVPAPDRADGQIDLAEIVGFDIVFPGLPLAFGRGPQ